MANDPASQASPADQHMVESSGEPPAVTRDNLGRFVKGVSGNIKGKPVGSKNRTKLMKQAMEEALTRDLSEDFLDILAQAVKLAKQGDTQMIKLVLVDLMKDVRGVDAEETVDAGGKKIEVSITQFLGQPVKEQEITVDGMTVIPKEDK